MKEELNGDDLELIDADQTCRELGGEASAIDKSTLYRGIKKKIYPGPVKVGPGLSRWLRGEVRACKRAMIAARDRVA